MMRHNILAAGIVAVGAIVTTPLSAATLSGKITDIHSVGLSGMEVRVWTATDKGYEIDTVITTGADGTYSFQNLPAGTYKLDARMAPMVTGNFGDRWYDVAPPMANGYVGSDADELVLADADVLTGMNIELEVLGGIDVSVGVANRKVRAELKSDPRIHHNTDSQGAPHNGMAYFRGMVPGQYRLLAYDPTGASALGVFNGPFAVTSGSDLTAPDQTFSAMPADPSEPNESTSDAGTPTISTFPFSPQGASVGTGNDLDYYCFNGVAGERYEASVTSTLTIEGQERRHPWFDPVVGLFDGTGIIATNDDATPGQTWDSFLDSGPLPADGRYCFVVSTFGDNDLNGTGKLSRGEYQVEIDYGNRPPTLDVDYMGADAPLSPMEISVDEDQQLTFDLAYADPDGDTLNLEVRHFDNAGAPVSNGVLTQNPDNGTYVWTPGQQDATLSPFDVTFRLTDSEYDIRYPVRIRVGAVSVPPTVPTPIEPADGSSVETTDVTLVVANSTDADGDALTYDFQVEVGEPDGTPEFENTEGEDASGMTSSAISGLAENDQVSWRARAYDGADYSGWSDWSTFIVDAVNDPPAAPVILKPSDGERVQDRQPTIASDVPEDPEGDAVTVKFEVAPSPQFEAVIYTSSDVAADTDPMMISWQVTDLLDFGGEYYVRAQATDERGAVSEWSTPVRFGILFENALPEPGFSGDWAACERQLLDTLPTEVVILNVDPSGDIVTFEVEVVAVRGDGAIVATGSSAQSTDVETTVTLTPIDGAIEPGDYNIRVRALREGETTEWLECPLTLRDNGGGGSSDEGTEDEGCGCGTAGGSTPAALLFVFGFGFLRRRRRNARRPR